MSVQVRHTEAQLKAVAAVIEREFNVDAGMVPVDSLRFESHGGDMAIMTIELTKVVPLEVVNEVLRGGQ